MRSVTGILLILLVLFPAVFSSCGNEEGDGGKTDLVIFHAGSLSVPLKRIAGQYMKENTGVNILLEAAGSRACARKISELGRECDVMASADYTVIDQLLIPDYASWNIKFAGNEMTIVYHEGSMRADEIDADNWFMILMEDDVAFGRSDPDSDPCGYRAVLTMRLSEMHYRMQGLADGLLEKDTRYIRPKETDLIALLESGSIDYIFLYRSVAQQHGLDYLVLPGEINLADLEMTDFYEKVSVKISGKKPGQWIIKKGAPMVYGLTIPLNAPHPEIARSFVEYLLSEDFGMAVMKECGQPSAIPSYTDTYDALPESLRRFALPERSVDR
jgi:molybdate/tungstate transport system substrate-binding protein